MLFRKKHIRADIAYLKQENAISRKKIGWLVLAGGLLLGINWLSFIYVVNHVNLKSAAFAYMVCPIVTAIGGFFILKEQLSRLKVIAVGIALMSIIISAQGSLTDVLWAIFIAASFAFYLIVQRVIVKLDKINLLGIQLGIIGLLVLPIFLYQPQLFPLELNFWANILAIAVLFTVIPLLLSSYSLIGLPSSTFGIIIYLNPIISFATAFAYFNEEIKREQLYAYSLLFASVVIFNWDVIRGFFNKKAIQ